MDESQPSSPIPLSATIDACVMIALCAKEATKYEVAVAEWSRLATEGHQFYAPGVMIAETLFVLCKMHKDQRLTDHEHAESIQTLSELMTLISPPPGGEDSLIARAHELQGGYGCSHSADGLYLALTEQLAQKSEAWIVTFDAKMKNQVQANAPGVKIRILSPV